MSYLFLLNLFVFCQGFKIESPTLLKIIEEEAENWYKQNNKVIKLAAKETEELIKIFQLAIARSEATIKCQKYLLEHTNTIQDAWKQLNANRLNAYKLDQENFIKFQDDLNWVEAINEFQIASYQYAQAINFHKLLFLSGVLTDARKKNREIIVRTLKHHTQKRSMFDKLINQINEHIPIVKDICGEFGKYLWDKLPSISLTSFKKIDDEFQKASIYSWDAITILEKQSCKMWNNIENARACFYTRCLDLLLDNHNIVNTQ
jgi:hypothetical protein